MQTLMMVASGYYVCARWRQTTQVLAMSLAVFLCCVPTFSQVNLGRISGTVTDQTGGVVVGATVTVLDVERNLPRILTTDTAGAYSASNLQPGKFTVKVEAAGFNTLERRDIEVGVGQETRVDLSLQPGSQTQTVTVTGEAPIVNTSNAQLEGDVDNQTVSELPINGRQYRTLFTTVPGLIATPGTGNNKEMGFEGTRPENLVYLIDGVYSVSPHSGTPTIGGSSAGGGPDQSTILPVDGIQEVNIIGNPKAEYGWKPGAQINIGLKSGTNEIHGTAFAFGRDGIWDAKNPFLTAAQPKPSAELEQYGGSIGGPIKKDKLFYFGSYEAQHYNIGTPKLVNEPTTASLVTASAANGDTTNSFPDAIAAMLKSGFTPSQLSLNLAGCPSVATLKALPIATSSAGQLAGMISCSPTSLFLNAQGANVTKPQSFTDTVYDEGSSENFIAKLDYHLNDHNAFNGEMIYGTGYMYYPGTATTPFWAAYDPTTSYLYRAVWIWTPNSTWLNEARFGYERSPMNSVPAECAGVAAPNYQAQFGFVSGVANHPSQFYGPCSFPDLTINTFTMLGAATSAPAITLWYNYEGSDVVSYTHGKHLFKFGTDIRRSGGLSGTFTAGKGVVNFGTNSINAPGLTTSLEDFLDGYPSTGSLLTGNALVNLSYWAYGLFAQDDYRVTTKLTLNIGLRWEGDPPIKAANNQAGAFDPTSPTGMRQQTSSQGIYDGDYLNFAPRLGLAYDLSGKGTTVIRASGGIIYDTTPYFLVLLNSAFIQQVPTGFTLFNADGSVRPNTGTINTGTVNYTPTQLAPNWGVNSPLWPSALSPSCSNGIIAAPAGYNPAICQLEVIDPNFRIARTYTWNLGVQHAFSNNTSMTVSYVGNHGSHLGGTVDLNQPALGASGTTTEQVRRPYYSQFPYIGQIGQIESEENSSYNSLIVNMTQRVTSGLSFNFNYTWAHSIEQTPFESGLVMDSTHPQLDKGNGAFDTRNHVTLTATYLLPGIKSPGQILQGWGATTNLNVMQGIPWNAADTTSDFSGTGELLDRWTLVGNPSDFKAGAAAQIPCWGITGSSFAKAANCTTVANLNAMPAACVSAAANEPINSSVAGSSGTASLTKDGCYMMGNSAIVPPAQGTFGTMAKDALRVPTFTQWDLAVTKDWKIKERLTTQFRAEFYNIINMTRYASPSSNPAQPSTFGQAQSTPENVNPVIGSGSPRKIQLALKFAF